MAKERAGTQFDPALCKLVSQEHRLLFVGLQRNDNWELFLESEPGEPRRQGRALLQNAALSFARFADLKSRWTLGHAEGVAKLVFDASESLATELPHR